MRRGSYRYHTSSNSHRGTVALVIFLVTVVGLALAAFPQWFFVDGGNGQSDTISPETTLASAIDGFGRVILGNGTTLSNTITFSFTGSDNVEVAKFEGRLDTGPYGEISNPITISNLPIGIHFYFIRAVDTTGNVDPTPSRFIWSISSSGGGGGGGGNDGDTVAPETSLMSAQEDDTTGSYMTSGSSTDATGITFIFAGTDDTSISKYEGRLDSDSFLPITSPLTLTDLQPGQHTYYIRAVDTTGNVDPTPIVFTWTINEKAPPPPPPPDLISVVPPELPPLPATSGYSLPVIGGSRPLSVTYGSTVHTVCDSGCTHNTIRTAIDSLPSDGGRVILKGPKTYTPQSTIFLSSNIVIEFEPGATIIYGGAGKVFSGSNIHDVMFVNPVITRTNAEDIFHFINSKSIIINGGTMTGLKGSASNGFECKSCIDIYLLRGTYQVFARPIDIGTVSSERDGTTSNIWIEGNTIRDSSVECLKTNNGIDVHNNGNNIRDCTNNGIDVGYNLRAEVRGNTIYHAGYGRQDNAVGIHTDTATTVLIASNTIDHSGTEAITACGSDNNFIVDNELLYSGQNIDVFTGSGYGVEAISCAGNTIHPDNTVIDQNTIKFNAKGGVYVGNDATNVRITNNYFEGNGASGTTTITGNLGAITVQSGNTSN